MNSKQIFLALLFCVSNMVFSDSDILTREDLEQKSFEELLILHKKRFAELATTEEGRKLAGIRKEYDKSRAEFYKLYNSCQCSKSWTCFMFGSSQDCEKYKEKEEEFLYKVTLLLYANKKLEEAYPDMKLLKEVVLERGYGAS